MKKEYFTVIIFFLFFNFSFGQRKNDLFQMVNVNDSVRRKLYSFIWEERKDSIKAGMYIYHLLGEDKTNNYKFVEGIYRFRLMGPHFPIYYFIYTKKDGIRIIRNYSIENVLTKVIEYFRENESSLDEMKKLDYTETIIIDLKQRYKGPDQ